MGNVLSFRKPNGDWKDVLKQTAAEREMKKDLPFMGDRGPHVNIRLGFVFGLLPSVLLTEIDFHVKYSDASIAHAGEIWIGLTYKDLEDELGGLWKVSSIKKAIKELRESGALWAKRLSCIKQDRTNYYAIDYDKVYELCQRVYGKDGMRGE